MTDRCARQQGAERTESVVALKGVVAQPRTGVLNHRFPFSIC
jgi:hypothetical protein